MNSTGDFKKIYKISLKNLQIIGSLPVQPDILEYVQIFTIFF